MQVQKRACHTWPGATLDAWLTRARLVLANREIVEDEFLPEVTKSKYVICHFYHREFLRCKIMDKVSPVAVPHTAASAMELCAGAAPAAGGTAWPFVRASWCVCIGATTRSTSRACAFGARCVLDVLCVPCGACWTLAALA